MQTRTSRQGKTDKDRQARIGRLGRQIRTGRQDTQTRTHRQGQEDKERQTRTGRQRQATRTSIQG
jgi:hypothetical protein